MPLPKIRSWRMPWRKTKANFHYMPFSHALVTALKLITSGWITHLGIFCNNPKAISHTIPFSQALIAASQLITSSCNAHFGTS